MTALSRALKYPLRYKRYLVAAMLCVLIGGLCYGGGIGTIATSRLTPLITASYQAMVGIISPGSYQRWKNKFLKKKKEIEKVGSEKIKDLTG